MTSKNCVLFLTGVGCGAAAAILFAPKSGADLRNQIATTAADGKRLVETTVTEKVEGVRRAINRRAEVVDHTIKEGVAAFKEVQEAFLNA